MDDLKQLFIAKKQFMADQEKAGHAPNVAQLAGFIRGMVAEIGAIIRRVNTTVQRRLTKCFSEFGWDVRANSATVRTPPSLAKVKELLDKCFNLLDSWTHRTDPKADELEDLGKATNYLWELDVNRLTPGKHYILNIQDGKKFYQQGDYASEKLFTYVNEEIFSRADYPTFHAFHLLLDNYERGTGITETVTAEELREEQAFLSACCETPVMQYCHKYLHKKGLAPADQKGFKDMLTELWFTMYRRGGHNDSSGFEHVFVGEEKDGKVIGLHNWVQFHIEEKAGKIDYRGYIKPHTRGLPPRYPTNEEQLISLQFSWMGEMKDVSSSFIGTSPEFELALYTICFLAGGEKNIIPVGPYRALITCYTYNYRGKKYIASSFPAEAPMTEARAATKIQARARGYHARSGIESHTFDQGGDRRQGAREYSSKQQHRYRQQNAAVKIQAATRGYKARKTGGGISRG